MSYTKEFAVGSPQCGFDDCMRPSALFECLQDVATLDSERSSFSREHMMETDGIFWMLVRQKFYLRRPIRHGEQLEISTWHRGVKGVQWYRDMDIRSAGEAIGSAITSWVTADFQTRGIVKPSAAAERVGIQAKKLDGGELLGHFSVPEQVQFIENRRVGYSFIDLNGHMNNVKAVEMLCDGAQLHHFPDSFVSSVQINYLQESRPDETLAVARTQADRQIYVCLSGMDGAPRVEAAFTLSAR